jgi:hypothetical protein
VVQASALLIEQLAVNAWPAAIVQLVDGWLLRSTPRVTRRRSNSALPSPDASRASAAQRTQVLDLAERFYTQRHQATVVQVSPAALHGQLDRDLAARGYHRQAPTVVLTAPLDRLPDPPPTTPTLTVSVADTVIPQWLAAWTAIEPRPDAAATSQQVLARIGPPAGYLTATHDREVLGVVMVGGRAGLGRAVLYGHPTRRPPMRGRHHDVQHAARWAGDQGRPAALSLGGAGQPASPPALPPSRLPALPPLPLPDRNALIGSPLRPYAPEHTTHVLKQALPSTVCRTPRPPRSRQCR